MSAFYIMNNLTSKSIIFPTLEIEIEIAVVIHYQQLK